MGRLQVDVLPRLGGLHYPRPIPGQARQEFAVEDVVPDLRLGCRRWLQQFRGVNSLSELGEGNFAAVLISVDGDMPDGSTEDCTPSALTPPVHCSFILLWLAATAAKLDIRATWPAAKRSAVSDGLCRSCRHPKTAAKSSPRPTTRFQQISLEGAAECCAKPEVSGRRNLPNGNSTATEGPEMRRGLAALNRLTL